MLTRNLRNFASRLLIIGDRSQTYMQNGRIRRRENSKPPTVLDSSACTRSGTARWVGTNRHPDGPNSSGHWKLELSVLRVFRCKARAVPDLDGIRVMSGQ